MADRIGKEFDRRMAARAELAKNPDAPIRQAVREMAAQHAKNHEARAKAGVDKHHEDVPKAGGGGHGGNPNHDEHGRFA